MYTLHKLPEEFIITSGDDFHNKNLKPNDLAYHRKTKEILQVVSKKNETGDWLCNDNTNRDSYKLLKVIAQQNQIDFSVLSEREQKEIGWFDVDELSNEHRKFELSKGRDLLHSVSSMHGFKIGFQKAQELISDRMFTSQDMLDFYYWLKKSYGPTKPLEEAQIVHRTTPDKIIEMFIQSISQPKSWKIELEMEEYSRDMPNIHSKYYLPKITDGNVKILKLS